MQNTIVSAGVADPGSENCAAPAVSLGHNLDSHDQCGFHAAGDLINKDPVLGPLQNNGGPLQTMALQPGSPAIDAGAANVCPAVDARGVLRPAGAACDMGAFELATPAATTGQASMIAPGSAVVSGVGSDPDLAGASAVFQYGTTTAYSESTPGQPVSPTTAAAPLKASLVGLSPATTYHFRIVVKNAAGSVSGTDHTFTTSQPTPGSGAPPPAPARAQAPPKIAKLKVTPATLSVKQSATVSYTDTQAARTAFTLQRAMPGRLDGHGCSTATKHNRRHRHCVRWVSVRATFTHSDTPGSNHFRFSARPIARKLAEGQYRLQATPRAHGLVGRTLTAELEIKAPTPNTTVSHRLMTWSLGCSTPRPRSASPSRQMRSPARASSGGSTVTRVRACKSPLHWKRRRLQHHPTRRRQTPARCATHSPGSEPAWPLSSPLPMTCNRPDRELAGVLSPRVCTVDALRRCPRDSAAALRSENHAGRHGCVAQTQFSFPPACGKSANAGGLTS
jgi:hypothetical protein